MSINYTYINKVADLKAVWPTIDFSKPVGIDIETTNELEPWKGQISTIQIYEMGGTTTFIIDALQIGISKLGMIADLISNPRILKIAHNAKFEIKWFLYHFEVEPESFFDTMLASQMIAAGDISASHDLGTVARVFTGITLDKDEQKSDWSQRPLTTSQLEYAAWDAYVVPFVYEKQVERLIADDLTRTATIEFDAIRPIARAEINGFHLDRKRWSDLLEVKKEELARIKDELLEFLQPGVDWGMRNPDKVGKRPKKPEKPTNYLRSKEGREAIKNGRLTEAQKAKYTRDYDFAMGHYEQQMQSWLLDFEDWEKLPDEIPAVLNPSSHTQIKKVLLNVCKLKLESTKNEFLLPHEEIPAVAKLLEYRAADKSVSSYGENFLALQDENGRVHTNFKQIKDTGRMGSAEPNIQQIPHDVRHRRCFTAPRGRKLVIADYSQIELRVLAQFGQDAAFVDDFNSGVDLHTKGASRFMSVRVEDVTKEMRTGAKRTNFGVVYGIGDRKLGAQLRIPSWKAKDLKEKYFKNYPGNGTWLQKANRQAQTHLFARTMSGRIQRFSHDGSIGQMAAVGRNGMNMPIQGTSADMLKRALYLLDIQIRFTTTKLVNIVHDELVLEADDHLAEWSAEVLTEAMIQAGKEYITIVDVPADALISDEWVKE